MPGVALGWEGLIEEFGSRLVTLHLKGILLAESCAPSKNWPSQGEAVFSPARKTLKIKNVKTS